MIARLKNHEWEQPLAKHFVSVLSEEDKKYVETALAKLPRAVPFDPAHPERETAAKLAQGKAVYDLAKTFLDQDSSDREKLASCSRLVDHKKIGRWSIPRILAGTVPESAEATQDNRALLVTIDDIDQFLMTYQPIHFDDMNKHSTVDRYIYSLNMLSHNLSNSERELIITPTIGALSLPGQDPRRKDHAQNLTSVFQDTRQPSSAKLAAGIGLLLLGTDEKTGAVKQKLGEQTAWSMKFLVHTYEGLLGVPGYISIDKEIIAKDFKTALSTAKSQVSKELSQNKTHGKIGAIRFCRIQTGKDSTKAYNFIIRRDPLR